MILVFLPISLSPFKVSDIFTIDVNDQRKQWEDDLKEFAGPSWQRLTLTLDKLVSNN